MGNKEIVHLLRENLQFPLITISYKVHIENQIQNFSRILASGFIHIYRVDMLLQEIANTYARKQTRMLTNIILI